MGVIRRLVTVVELQADKAAKALAKYDALWKTTAKSIGAYAASVEADANRVIAAAQRMATTINTMPRPGRGGSGGTGEGGGGRRGVDPTAAANREAARAAVQAARAEARRNQDEAKQAARDAKDNARAEASLRRGAGRGPAASRGGGGGMDDLDRAIAAANRAEGARAAGVASAQARMAGLAAGSTSVRAAADALGFFASKSDRAKAAVKDLEAQVSRNRKEMADLKAQALATGDADGRLADRMKGLAVATGQAQVKLGDARKELRAVDGGLIDAVNNSKKFSFSLSAMSVAAGNFINSGLSRAVREVAGAVVGATEKAIKFESSFADVKKVLPDDMSVQKVNDLEAGLLKLGPAVGVLPTQMAELTAGLAQSGIAGDQLLAVAEDASKVGVAFDLTGKEAGHAFASIQAALGTTRGETNSLFDTINELSNGMNSTAAQLVEVEERVGSVGRAMSLSGETVAALGSALVSTGASSEVAATGVRTFLARLGAGAAATPKQLAAFQALGLSATETAKALSSGDMQQAEGTIRRVVKAIQDLPNEDRLPVLIELFGSESIGTIGALATNVELLGTAFEISGNKTKAAGSVQREFDNRSKTTEHQLQRVKAGVEVLAIEFGKALLPSITEVANYLNSPEGQEWGRAAVQDLIGLVKSLVAGLNEAWPVIKGVGQAFVDVGAAVGGATTAVGLLGVAALSLAGPAGPFAAAAIAGVAAGKAIVDSFMSAERKMNEINAAANKARADEHAARAKTFKDDLAADQAGQDAKVANRKRAQDLADRYYRQKVRGATSEADRLKAFRQATELRNAVEGGNRTLGGGTEEDRLAEFAKMVDAAERPSSVNTTAGGQARFDALSAKVLAGQKLKPSEAKEYSRLSKSLDAAKATKSGGGRGHKATKMDQQLAAMDPGVRALLTRGGASDAGGDLKRADNVLDRAVFARATGGSGGGGSSGPGPNVTTIYNTTNNNVQVQVDASSSNPAAENIRSAAQDLGNAATNVRFTGAAKIVAARNAGGRIG